MRRMMASIHVVDFTGDHTVLFPLSPYRVSEKGLVELWCWRSGDSYLSNYRSIPIPVFTDWWPR